MSQHTATLMYGNDQERNSILDYYTLDNNDLAAALLNAFKRIAELEKQLQDIKMKGG